MAEKLAVGIDLGGTNITAALVSGDGTIQRHEGIRTHAERGAGPVIDDMAALVKRLCASVRTTADAIVGLGVGAPGPLSPREGIIYQMANLPGWRNIRLRQELSEKTGLPAELDNDANAAGLGEFWAGAGRGTRHLVVLTLGTGIGSGVIVEGEVLRGHFENAAELGHMIVSVDGRQCPCGQRGCLEQYASAGNVAAHCVAALRAGERSSLTSRLERGDRIDAQAIAEAAHAGDAFAERIWDDACRHLAVGCVNIQHAFNPEMVVFAGGMSAAGDALLSRVRAHFNALTWKLAKDGPTIAISTLGDKAGVIGAARLAWLAHEKRLAAG
jgi:glucokinase